MIKNKPVLIILAGGKSSRMGSPKGLLKHQNDYWLLSQIENFVGNEVSIGLGFDNQKYFDAIPWLEKAVEKQVVFKGKKVEVILNQTPEFGLFSTLFVILRKLDLECVDNNVLILPIDVPLLNTKEQEKLILDNHTISIPTYKNKKGHPIKLAPTFWKSLLQLDITDVNSRLDFQIKLRNASEISFIETNDASVLKNLNTPKEWQEFTSI